MMTIKVVPTKGVCYLPSGSVIKGEATVTPSKEIRRAIAFGDLMVVEEEAEDDLSLPTENTTEVVEDSNEESTEEDFETDND